MRTCPRREDSPMASPELAAVQSVRPRTASWSDGVPIIISLTAALWGLDLRARGDEAPLWETRFLMTMPWYHNMLGFRYFFEI